MAVRRPRASTLGASKGSFFVKKSREMAKNEEKMSLPGHDEAREGASRERIVINLTTDEKRSSEILAQNGHFFPKITSFRNLGMRKKISVPPNSAPGLRH